MLTDLLNRVGRVIDILLAMALAIMVVLVFGNVVLRYGFNSGITTSEELSRWLFVWLTFLGAIVAMKDGAHLGTDALVSRLPLRGKQVFFVLSHGLMLYACWLLFWGAWDLVQNQPVCQQCGHGGFHGLVLCARLGAVLFWRIGFGEQPAAFDERAGERV